MSDVRVCERDREPLVWTFEFAGSDEGVAVPACVGCGATAEPGLALVMGKPPAWFSRTIDGVTEYACSRACIPEREMAMPW